MTNTNIYRVCLVHHDFQMYHEPAKKTLHGDYYFHTAFEVNERNSFGNFSEWLKDVTPMMGCGIVEFVGIEPVEKLADAMYGGYTFVPYKGQE